MSGAIPVQSPVQTPFNWGGVHTPITPACVCTPKGFAHAQGTQNKQATARPSPKPGQDHSARRGAGRSRPPRPLRFCPAQCRREVFKSREQRRCKLSPKVPPQAPPHEKETTWR